MCDIIVCRLKFVQKDVVNVMYDALSRIPRQLDVYLCEQNPEKLKMPQTELNKRTPVTSSSLELSCRFHIPNRRYLFPNRNTPFSQTSFPTSLFIWGMRYAMSLHNNNCLTVAAWESPQLMKVLPGQIFGRGSHAQGQLHSTRTPADSVWSPSYKTEQMFLGGWGSVTRHPLKFGCS